RGGRALLRAAGRSRPRHGSLRTARAVAGRAGAGAGGPRPRRRGPLLVPLGLALPPLALPPPLPAALPLAPPRLALGARARGPARSGSRRSRPRPGRARAPCSRPSGRRWSPPPLSPTSSRPRRRPRPTVDSRLSRGGALALRAALVVLVLDRQRRSAGRERPR